MTQTYHSANETKTEAFGARIAAHSKNLAAIALSGELGAGKTALVRGLVRALGCRDAVSSPTYAIVNEYRGELRKVCHFDLYRLSGSDALWEIGWQDYLDSGALCVVEWSEVAPDLLPKATLWIKMEITGENTRLITIDWPEGIELC